MPAKPWSTSGVANVAAHYMDLRISGDVKQSLVELLVQHLDVIIKDLESETLQKQPDRKTLDDPARDRLGFSRTRGLILDRVKNFDSVGSAAVIRANEELETYLAKIIQASAMAAESERVGTIKPRHLDKVLKAMGYGVDLEQVVDGNQKISTGIDSEDEALNEALGGGSVLTPSSLKKMARTFAGMPVTNDALEELLLVYYDVVEKVEADIRTSFLGGNPQHFIESIDQMKGLMQMGWMKRMLERSAKLASDKGYKRIDVEQVVHLDPFD